MSLEAGLCEHLFFLSPQGIVQQFLVLLMTSPDQSLRFLSFRLDFNEHYRCVCVCVCVCGRGWVGVCVNQTPD